MRHPNPLRLSFLMLFAIGCAGANTNAAPPPQPSTELIKIQVGPQTLTLTRDHEISTIELPASRDRVWKAVVAAHETLGLAMSSLDNNAGVAVYVHQRSHLLDGNRLSKYIDCGTTIYGDRTDSYAVTVRVTATVESRGPNTTAVHSGVNAWARDPQTSSDAVACSSTGLLEQRIAELIAAGLK
jgi:hypothetical protein